MLFNRKNSYLVKMPEGPEVKIHTEKIRSILEGKLMRDFNILNGPFVAGMDMKYQNFREVLGQIKELLSLDHKIVINSVECKGKLIHMELEIMKYSDSANKYISVNFLYFICHLGMSGNWRKDKTKHTMMELVYSSNDSDETKELKGEQLSLYFDDVRRYGRVDFVKASEIEGKLELLGPDVLTAEFQLPEFIRDIRACSKRAIVKIIADQSVISGVGNIYRSDALYLAKIHPLREASSLTADEIERLYNSIKFVTLQSYVAQGTTIKTYKGAESEPGNYVTYVYGRKHDSGGNPVDTFKLENRTIWYVKSIQK